jgi:hypothetical protein
VETLNGLRRKYGKDGYNKLKETGERVYGYQKRVLHNYVDSGILSEGDYEKITELNPHYVPMNRVIEGVEEFGGKGAGLPGLYKIEGSDREVKDVFGSIIKNTNNIMKRAYDNEIKKDAASLGAIFPGEVKVVKEKGKGKYGITYFENGERKHLEVSEQIHDALNDVSEEMKLSKYNPLVFTAKLVKMGATAYNPAFILKNYIRDNLEAAIQTKGFVPFVNSLRRVQSIIRQDKDYQGFLRAGASMGSFMELSERGIGEYAKMLTKEKSGNILKKGLRAIEKGNELAEMSVRLGVYKKAKARGLSDIKAAAEARDATLDFARMGRIIREANRIIPFLNAGIQGADKFLRTFKKQPIRTLFKSFIYVSGMSSLISGYYLIAADEKDRQEYLEIPDWRKAISWNVKMFGHWVAIPKPFVHGLVFGSFVERWLEQKYKEVNDIEDKGYKELFKNSVWDLLTSLSPVQTWSNMMPPLIKAPTEAGTNTNLFTWNKLYSEHLKRYKPSERYGKNTTETAKKIGKVIGMSPAVIDNTVRTLGAGVGMEGLKLADLLGNTALGWGKDKPERELEEKALINQFTTRKPIGSNSQSVTDYYKNKEKYEEEYNTIQKKMRENEAGWQKYEKDHKEESDIYENIFYPADKKLTDIRSEIKEIENNDKMSGKKKREQINKLEEEMTEIARNANIELYKRLTGK